MRYRVGGLALLVLLGAWWATRVRSREAERGTPAAAGASSPEPGPARESPVASAAVPESAREPAVGQPKPPAPPLAPKWRAHTITGRVLDPEGRPRPRAEVRFFWARRGRPEQVSDWTDAEGRFQLALADAGARGDLLATVAGHTLAPALRTGVEAGGEALTLQLGPPSVFALQVVDPYGAALVPERVSFHWVLADWTREDRDDALGKLRWARPPCPFRVHLDDRAIEGGWFGPFAPEEVGDVLTLRVPRYPTVEGRVLHEEEAVSGATVEVEPFVPGRTGGLSRAPWGETGRTDARGEFRLLVRSPGSYRLRAFHPDHGVGRALPLELDGTQDRVGIVLELSEPLGSVRGRVVLPAGRAPAEIRLFVAERRRSLRGDGTFLLPGLEPGHHVLRIVEGPPGEPEDGWLAGSFVRTPSWLEREALFPVDVEAGRIAEVLLDLTAPPPVRLEGRVELGASVIDATGAFNREPVGAVLERAPEGDREGRALLDAQGGFSLGLHAPGPYRLRLALMFVGAESSVWSVTDAVTLAPGAQDWRLALEPGSLRIRVGEEPEELGLAPPSLAWRGEGGLEVTVSGARHEPDGFLYEHVPPGALRCTLSPGGETFEVAVRSHETAELLVPQAVRDALRAAFDARPRGLVEPSYLEVGAY